MDLDRPDLLLSDDEFASLLANIPTDLGLLVSDKVQVLPIEYALRHMGRLYLAIWSHAENELTTHVFGAELVPVSEWMGLKDPPHPLYGKRVRYESSYYAVDELVLFSTEAHVALHKALQAGTPEDAVPDIPPPETESEEDSPLDEDEDAGHTEEIGWIGTFEDTPNNPALQKALLVSGEESKEDHAQIRDSTQVESRRSPGELGLTPHRTSDTVERFESHLLAFQHLEMEFAAVHRRGLQEIKEGILIRFRQGKEIDASMGKHYYGQARHGEASVVMETWSGGTGYGASLLYRWRTVARVMETEHAVKKWIETQLEQAPGIYPTVHWTALINHCLKSLRATKDGRDNSETTAERVERRKVQLERRTNQLRADAEGFEHELMEVKGEIPTDAFDEAVGVVAKALEDAGDTTNMLERLEYEKPERVTDLEHLAYVRLRPCCVCGKEQGIEAHHLRKGGMGTKGPDLFTTPLCREHHQALETSPVGEKKQWEAWEVTPWEIVCCLLAHRIDKRVTLPD